MAKRKYIKENNLVKAINTDSLELQKPLVNEYYDINVHNSNMDKIDAGYKQNKNDISNINYELSKTENTKYSTENGVKEFSCKDGYVDNVVIEGETLVNLGKTIIKNVGNDAIRTRFEGNGDDYRSRYSGNTFTLINYTDKVISFPTMKNTNNQWTTQYDVRPNSRIAVQIPNDTSLVGVDFLGINGWTVSNDTVINDSFFAVLEGDHTDKPISYFEGLKSVGQGDKIEVVSYQENQEVELRFSCFKANANLNDGVFVLTDSTTNAGSPFLYVDGGKVRLSRNGHILLYDKNFRFIRSIVHADTNTFDINDASYIRLWYADYDVEFIAYHTPYLDKKQISTTLRSLPNGVKDTIEKRGNKYVKVQRCGEVTLNGSENWNWVASFNNVIRYSYFIGGVAYKPSEINCNSDKFKAEKNELWNNNSEQIDVGNGDISINVMKNKLSNTSYTDSLNIKTWLQANPITVVYELATPQIIELPNFNPQTYEGDTTLLLNTGVIQAECEFEVTNSMGSEIEVMKNKLSDIYDYVDRELVSEANRLKNILVSKNVEVSEEENKLSILIQKVDEMENPNANKLWLYKEGVFNPLYEKVEMTEASPVDYQSTYFELKNKGVSGNDTLCRLSIKNIDFTNYTNLKIECDANVSSSTSANFTINIAPKELLEPTQANAILSDIGRTSFSKGIRSINVANVNGVYHLNLTIYFSSLKTYKIWLEK